MAEEQPWRPQLVALDIDGTLLEWVEEIGEASSRLSPAVHDAVRRVVAAGVPVVLSSGRSADSMIEVADLLGLGHDGEPVWVVAANGSTVFTYPPMIVQHRELFDARQQVEAILSHNTRARIAVEAPGLGYLVSAEFPPGELGGRSVLTPVDLMGLHEVSRVIVRDPEATVEDFDQMVEKLGLHGTEYVVGWTAWLDLNPVGVSKASGLTHVVEALGLTAPDVLAIGDGRNDIEMLRWAGRGVAMGQAVDLVKSAADAVTKRIEEDGVAVELDNWFGPGTG